MRGGFASPSTGRSVHAAAAPARPLGTSLRESVINSTAGHRRRTVGGPDCFPGRNDDAVTVTGHFRVQNLRSPSSMPFSVGNVKIMDTTLINSTH